MNEYDLLNNKMSFGQIINESVALYRKTFKHFLNVSLIFLLPVVVLSILNMDVIVELQETLKNMNADKFDFSIFKTIASLSYISIIETIIFLYYKMALVKMAESFITNQQTNIKSTFLFVLSKFFPILLTNILMFIMLIFGFILFFIPGLILTGMLVFVPQAVMLENKNYFSSFDRSFFIIRKNFWEVVLIPIVLYFVYFFIVTISGTIISVINYAPSVYEMVKSGEINETPLLTINKWINLVDSLITYMIFILITPLIEIAVTMKFINLRNIKEGKAIFEELNKKETFQNPIDDDESEE